MRKATNLKEVCVGFLELALSQVHLSSTFPRYVVDSRVCINVWHKPDDSKDKRMGNCRFDVEALIVQGFQFLVVLLSCVHLDLKGIHLFNELNLIR